MYKTHTCGELRPAHQGQTVTLAGWVHRRRDHGGLVFIDLRDRYGITQIVANPDINAEVHDAIADVRAEWVIRVEGIVEARPSEMVNSNLETGEIEVSARHLTVLNPAKTPPFAINKEDELVDETLRLKYRYLDLRRPRMARNLVLRHKMVKFIRDYMDQEGFIEVETPILFKTTPEGARDYLVPSRVHPGEFYALPQSPQQLKQLLMVAGVERYFQIARCFRDEDLRGDRQPEFTQLDLEMSYVHRDDILAVVEGLFTAMVPALVPHKRLYSSPWPKFSHSEVMDRYGVDKPDLRFGLELVDVGEIFTQSEFKVFQGALGSGAVIKCIVAPGCAAYSRKEQDDLVEFAKAQGARGLVTLGLAADGLKGSGAKFVSEAEVAQLRQKTGAQEGDLILFVADQKAVANKTLGQLRLLFRDRLNLADKSILAFAWVVDFPMFEWNEEEKKWDAAHHPFTMPRMEHLDRFETDPGSILSDAYDMVCNGYEVASGSIRIHRSDIQRKVFELLGLSEEEIEQKFGHLIEAFQFGAPPHGGMAPGIDRIVMLFADEPNIREVIPFPKNQAARDVMADAPSAADAKQLKELHLKVV
ncbi:MAG: aspartate--tRNA ligase [Chloroflexota bacterium]